VDRLKKDINHKIAEQIGSSPYFIATSGIRGLGTEELSEFIKIVRTNKTNDILEMLSKLYKYSPDTIEIDRCEIERNCPGYLDSCTCYLPDTNIEDVCWQHIQRKLDIQRERGTAQYQSWRTNIFIRDQYTCQLCGKIGGQLNAHHKKFWSKYPDLRFEDTNGITLCETCHKKEHKK
jgi:5-methylcytosine-specific restriction endonuclease McrA